MTNLTIEEKARQRLESKLASWARIDSITPQEVLEKWVESMKKTPEEFLDDEINIFREAHSVIEELVRNKGYRIRKSVPIINLNTIPNEYLSHNDIEPGPSVITNITQSRTLLKKFMSFILPNYFFPKSLLFRNIRDISDTPFSKEGRTKTLREKIEYILETGFDKPLDSRIWMSEYSDKVLDYAPGDWPKLISVYDESKMQHQPNEGEGYQYKFLTHPKQALQCLVWVYMPETKK